MNDRFLVLVLLVSALTVACGSPGGTTEPEIIVDGSTTTVVNADIPAWRGAGALIEETSIGSDSGDEAYLPAASLRSPPATNASTWSTTRQ